VDLAASYSAEEFAELVADETDEVELKSGLGLNPLQDALVALSNASGGVILVGVQDNGEVTGKRLDQASQDRIHQAAADARDVGRYRISPIDVDGTEVIAILVDRRVEGFSQTSSGRVLVRRGGQNVSLFGQDLTRFVNQRTLHRFELTETRLLLDQVDPARLQEICDVYDWDAESDDLPARLEERGLATPDRHLTIAGVLFLTDPDEALRQNKAMVEVRRYPEETGEYDLRREFRGPLHGQVADATGFIAQEIGSDVVVTGLYRHDLPRLPEVVVREAVANAAAHRSYEAQGSATIVELRPEAVIVTSPGGLPEPVTIENLRQAQAARNSHVIDVLRRFRLAEDAGRGVDVMQDSMQEALLDPPQFEDLGGAVRVTLPLRGPITPRERAWVADLERRGEIEAPDTLLLVHAARGEQLTNSLARSILHVDATEARAALRRLRDASLLEQRGERGSATYALVDDLAPPAAFRMTPVEIDRLVIEAAQREPISNETVRELTGLERRPALVLLSRLVREGRLRRTGSRRGTRYVGG
jgi:ATP-dependent DNA helicase RecG